MIRLVIADDHAIVRSGLKQLFSMLSDIEVVGEAANGVETMELLGRVECDLLLLDLTMPGGNAVNLITRIRERYPALRILILSMHDELQVAKRVFRAGAVGYVTKGSSPELLISAVRRTAGGQRFIDPVIAEQMVFGSVSAHDGKPHEVLSQREFHILKLLAQGKGINDIASELIISNKTVSTHKTRLMKKLGIQNNAELVRYAVDHSLVE